MSNKAVWGAKGHSIQGFRCVTLGNNGEKCLSGRNGEIWESGEGEYKCFEMDLEGNEILHSFEADELPLWVKRLEISEDPRAQVYWANNPDRRLLW